MVTNSWPRNRLSIAALAEAIAAARPHATVLLAVRVLDFERIAWREGRSRARAFERHAVAAFVRIALHNLRAGDFVAHDPGTDVLLAALLPLSVESESDLPRTARAVLSRLVRRIEEATGLTLESGWTVIEVDHALDPELRAATQAALTRGRRERERFEFFATLGHEMRTPLMSIGGYVATLMERDLDPDTQRRFLETAQLETFRLRRLVDGMYELSLMDLIEELPSGARCDVQNALERACDAIYPLASLRGTNVKLYGRIRSSMPLAYERAVVLFGNLLENAVKHGRAGGRVEIRVQENDGWLAAFIDDDGSGVAANDRRRIFERGERGTTTSAAGSGLGLAIVDRMLQRVGGDIEVSRSPLGGARFTVRIPTGPTRYADCGAGRAG